MNLIWKNKQTNKQAKKQETKTHANHELCLCERVCVCVCVNKHTTGSLFVRAILAVLFSITDKPSGDAFPACHAFEIL